MREAIGGRIQRHITDTWLEYAVGAATAIAIAVCVTVVGAVPLETFDHYPLTMTCALISLLVSLTPAVVRIATGRFDIFEPIIGGGVMLGLLFGLRPLVSIYTGAFDLYPGYGTAATLHDGALLGMAGTIAFVGGYECAVRQTGRYYSGRPETRVFNLEIVTVYSVGLFITALGLFALYVQRVGGIGTLLRGRSVDVIGIQSSEYLSAAPVAISCAAALWVLAKHGRLTTREKWYVAAVAVLAASSFALMGNRRFIIPCLAFPLIVGYLISGRRPRGRNLVLVIPLVFVVLATIPFARASGARQQTGGVVSIFTQALQNPGLAVSRFLEGNDTEMVLALGVQSNLQGRTDQFYFGRATVGDALLAPVPSLLVPDKPITARNRLLIELFGEPCTTVGGGRCPDFSVIGTFYQDLWWPGVLIGMLAFGAAIGRLWRQFQLVPTSTTLGVAVGVTTIFLPIIIRAGMMPAGIWALYFFFPTIVGILWTSRRASGTYRDERLIDRSLPGR